MLSYIFLSAELNLDKSKVMVLLYHGKVGLITFKHLLFFAVLFYFYVLGLFLSNFVFHSLLFICIYIFF